MRILAPLAALALAGCSDGLWGVYLIQIDALPMADCETSVTENWDDASPAGGGAGQWTYTSELEESPGLVFAELLELAPRKEAVLVVADESFRGSWDKGAGEWVFAHTNSQDGTSTEAHASGYSFSENGLFRVDRAFTMSPKDGVGTLSIEQTVDTTWTETDEWDASVGYTSGLINTAAATYLTGNRILNVNTGPECSGSTCELQVNESCSASTTVTFIAVRADDFDGVEDAGQPPGVGDR